MGWRQRILCAAMVLLPIACRHAPPQERGADVSPFEKRQQSARLTVPAPGADAGPRITAEFKDAPLREVLDYISVKSGHTIVMSAEVEDRVSIRFAETPWREAIDRACRQTPCVAREDGARIIVEHPRRVTMEFKRADLVEVIRLLAKEGGASVAIDKDVEGKVTMRFSEVPWMKALDAVVKVAGYSIVEEDGGRTLRVAEPQIQARVLRLWHIRADEPRIPIVVTSPPAGPVPSLGEFRPTTLLDRLRAMLSKPWASHGPWSRAGTLDYSTEMNSILVTDTKPVLDRMAQVIEEIDVAPVR